MSLELIVVSGIAWPCVALLVYGVITDKRKLI